MNWMKKLLGQEDETKRPGPTDAPYEDPSGFVVALSPDVKETWEIVIVKEAL